MSVIGHSPLAGASGAAGGGDPVYVDDVFSTFVYEGTGSARSINNGIDLSGKGGLVWIKRRDSSANHRLGDTERGTTKYLISNQNIAETTNTNIITSYNNNGFDLSTHTQVNGSSSEYASWTFRKAPGFFDVVTYSGTGSAQNISHSLGSVPGMIMIHCRDGTHDWEVYHRSTGATKSLHLNQADAQATDSTVWNNTTPTSSVFTVGTSSNVNQNGHGYVAYVFAHDEQSFGTDSDESIIKCGSYVGNDSSDGPEIDLGFEPQFVIIKSSTHGYNWVMVDNMRGVPTGGTTPYLLPHFNSEENTASGNLIDFTSTGFKLKNGNAQTNNPATYIYMAIRKPHKPPTAGTEVFAANVQTSPNYYKTFTTGFPVDLAIVYKRASSSDKWWFDRLRGGSAFGLESTTTDSESSSNSIEFDRQTTLRETIGFSTTDASGVLLHAFRRAPGVFDMVAYTGNNSTQLVSHNLEAVPELIIIKNRTSAAEWVIYESSIFGAQYSGTTTYTGYMRFSSGGSSFNPLDNVWPWNSTAPTSTTFSVGYSSNIGSDYQTNQSSKNYIAYLFASLDGISKVGSYSGTGSNVNVDCGFTAGARFVLIKRTDSSGDWYVWDSTRGIVSGNDPYLLLNSTAAEVTNTDYIDPLNAGFTVTSSAPAALNASGGTYLFLAIA